MSTGYQVTASPRQVKQIVYFYNSLSGVYYVFPIPNQSARAWAAYNMYEGMSHLPFTGWHKYTSYAAFKAAISGNPQWPAPTGSMSRGIGNLAPTAGSSILGSLTGWNQPHMWVRVGEVLGGLIVLFIGLQALARGTPAQGTVTATKSVVKSAVKG